MAVHTVYLRIRGRLIFGADIKHFTIIDIGHFQNRFADIFYLFFIINTLCKQTYYLQVTLFIGE